MIIEKMNAAKILFIALFVALAMPSGSKPRSQGEIMQAAAGRLVRNNPGMMRSAAKNMPLEILEQNEAYTVVGFSGGSYAIISNDDLLPAVLAYSASSFDDASSNPGFVWWSRSMRKVAAEIVASGVSSEKTLPDPERFSREVPQLMSDVWGQMEPFNNLCPLEYDTQGRVRGRCVVGCVATSATQVMHYHQYPPQGDGVHIDMQTEDAFGRPVPLKVDFADYKFDWANMLDSYSIGNYNEKQAEAVARLAYPVGVSFAMIYGTGASGTYSDSAVISLRKYLKFPDAQRFDRRGQAEKFWMETIYNELSNGRPVLYSGADPWGVVGGGGHAFVFDGYDADGLVHVNWGWYGRNDGYYEVALLNPRIHSFVDQQDMIIGVAPPALSGDADICDKLTGTLTAEMIADAVARSKEGELHELDLSQAVFADGKLPERAFYGSRLRRIVLPKSLRAIGNQAFAACRELREVVFPENSSTMDFMVENDIVYSRDGSEVIAVMPYYHNYEPVMTDYTSLLTFRPGVKVIRPGAADGCFRVQGVVIPASMERIGSFAFAGCTALKRVKCENPSPCRMDALAFPTLDPGFTGLSLPAGTSEAYARAGEWGRFFAFDNVYEYGTNVVARSMVRRVGEPNPELSYQIFGDYVSGQPELSCDATADSPAGEYAIKVSRGTLSSDDVVLTDGVMRVLASDWVSVEELVASGEPVDVYTTDGRLVASGIFSPDKLGKGIYIVGGRKVAVK